jgi:hypothetical protein
MGLKFHRIGTSLGHGVDKGMGQPKAAVMPLRDFGNNQAGSTRATWIITKLMGRRLSVHIHLADLG